MFAGKTLILTIPWQKHILGLRRGSLLYFMVNIKVFSLSERVSFYKIRTYVERLAYPKSEMFLLYSQASSCATKDVSTSRSMLEIIVN